MILIDPFLEDDALGDFLICGSDDDDDPGPYILKLLT
jgi:hypothetical protein